MMMVMITAAKVCLAFLTLPVPVPSLTHEVKCGRYRSTL